MTEIAKRNAGSGVACEIVKLHNELAGLFRQSLETAQRIGKLLADQKSHLPHGEFTSWVTDNLPFDARTARNYMRLYRERALLKTENVSVLSEAYKLLAEARVPRPIVDKEFSQILPELDPLVYAALEEDILLDGCHHRLTVWAGKNILLDGHARLAICEKHNIKYGVCEIDISDRDDAIEWIIKNQLGRKNLEPHECKELAKVTRSWPTGNYFDNRPAAAALINRNFRLNVQGEELAST